MDALTLLERVLLWAPPVWLAVSVHEWAHGRVALYCGDPSARRAGRLSVNPFKHIDPIGSLLVPGVLLLVADFVFGWARPVPVTVTDLNRPRRDLVLVAAAGPLANFVMALVWACALNVGLLLGASQSATGLILVCMGAAGVFVNAVLLALNLLPLPPLDGGRILAGLLPWRFGDRLSRIEPWGFLLIVAAVVAGLAGPLLWPVIATVMALATHWVGAPVEPLMRTLTIMLTGQGTLP